ncbi:unnamed protein product [Urochloa humidicola]
MVTASQGLGSGCGTTVQRGRGGDQCRRRLHAGPAAEDAWVSGTVCVPCRQFAAPSARAARASGTAHAPRRPRHAEGGRSSASAATGGYREEKDGLHAAPSTPQRVHDFEAVARGWSPCFSPTSESDRTDEKEEDSDDDQFVASEQQHDDALVGVGDEPVAAEGDGRDGEEALMAVEVEDNENAAMQEHADENPPDQDAVEAVTHILNLPDEMLLEIVNKLSARDVCRTVCSCRSILRAVRCGSKVKKRAVLMKPISPVVVTMQKAADSRAVLNSVSYIRDSLQMPLDTQIADCRNGHLLLKRSDEELYIWNPHFRRTDWVPVPRCQVNSLERYVAAALVPGDREEFYIAAVFATVPTMNTVLKIFSSSCGIWRTSETAIREHHLHPFSVHTQDSIFFLSLRRGNKSILKIDYRVMAAVSIAMPEGFTNAEVMISRVSSNLCLCKVELKRIKGKKLLIGLQLSDGRWVESWIHEIPEESYWTRLIGFGEETGMLIVGTGTEEIKSLKIADGVWVDMENCKIHSAAALEMENPFRMPFTLQPMDIGDHYFQKI